MVKTDKTVSAGVSPAEIFVPDIGELAFPSTPPPPPPFSEFALGVYPFLELQPFHRVYYRVLEAFAAGRIRRLIVTMPPLHG